MPVTYFSPPHLALGFFLAAVIAFAALRVGALIFSGALAATVVGTVIFGFGGPLWAAALLLFFGTSTALSRWRRQAKERLKYEKTGRRDAGQVMANGGVAALCALAHGFCTPAGDHALWVLFLTSLAAANADTWATEIGSALGGRPYLLTNLRPAPLGTSGAVSLAGTSAALAGALVIALLGIGQGVSNVLLVTGCGLAGALCDSLLGAWVQAQWQDPEDPDRVIEIRVPETLPVRGVAWIDNDFVNTASILFAVALAACFI